jgi:sterol 3beta-glucosyltransferase
MGVEKAGVRAIIAKGWSSRGGNPKSEGKNIEFPPSCYALDKIPHGWLFPKSKLIVGTSRPLTDGSVDAAMHHGGAGTVGASLRAGLPTLIKPWFGDQFFW